MSLNTFFKAGSNTDVYGQPHTTSRHSSNKRFANHDQIQSVFSSVSSTGVIKTEDLVSIGLSSVAYLAVKYSGNSSNPTHHGVMVKGHSRLLLMNMQSALVTNSHSHPPSIYVLVRPSGTAP